MKPKLWTVLFAAACFAVVAPGQVAHTNRDGPQVVIPNLHRRHIASYHSPVELTAVGVSIDVTDGVSATTLELTLSNPGGTQQEAQVVLPVPDGVTVSRLQYDGVGPEPVAQVLPRDEARRIYDSIVASVRDPALVEFVGWNLIKTSAFPIPPGKSQKVSLTYEQVLGADGVRTDYVLPRSEALAASGVAWTIRFDIRSKRAIATVYSPSNEIVTDRHGANRVTGRVVNSGSGDRGSFRLSYLTEKRNDPGFAITALAYPDGSLSEAGGGYVLLLASPATGETQARKVKREVTLVIDRSGSMRGEKFAQARAAARQVISGLNDGEFFNIIDYSDSIESFASAPVAKTGETEANALQYLDALQANGGTNLRDALLEALRPKPAAEGVLPLVLFLTDGLPTVGERNEVRIRDAAKEANAYRRRVFTFGVGLDVNSPLLSNLAKSSRAASTFVLPNEDVEVAVSQVYRRLSGPVMALPRLEVVSDGRGGTALRDMLPGELPDVFEGDQVVVLARYIGHKPVNITLSGEVGGAKREHTFLFDPAGASPRNSFVPRLWANRRVAALVEEIRQASAEGAGGVSDARMKELSEEITRLSIKYGILTEHTAFLAREDIPPVQLGAAMETTRDNLRARAAGTPAPGRPASPGGGRSGSSVAQERDINMKQAATQVERHIGYVAANQEVVRVTSIQAVADLTFFRRASRWVDSRILEQDQEKVDRTVVFGTPEYAKVLDELVAQNRQGVLAQEGEILLQLGKENILIKPQ